MEIYLKIRFVSPRSYVHTYPHIYNSFITPAFFMRSDIKPIPAIKGKGSLFNPALIGTVSIQSFVSLLESRRRAALKLHLKYN